MAMVPMSKQEFSRLDVLLRVQSGRLRVADACALMACIGVAPGAIVENKRLDAALAMVKEHQATYTPTKCRYGPARGRSPNNLEVPGLPTKNQLRGWHHPRRAPGYSMMLGADERLKGQNWLAGAPAQPWRSSARSHRYLFSTLRKCSRSAADSPQSQQCRSLLVGRLRHPKPFEFLDTRRHTGNMLRALLNMTFD